MAGVDGDLARDDRDDFAAAGKVTTNGRSEAALNGAEELHRLREMFARSPSFSVLLHGPEHLFVLTNPAYQQLIGHRDVVGLTVREAVPEVEGQGFFELLDNVFATGEPFVGKDVKITLQRTPGGDAETRYLDFVYQPIKDESGNVTSIFVEGLDVTERRATEQALRELNANLEKRALEPAPARGRPYLDCLKTKHRVRQSLTSCTRTMWSIHGRALSSRSWVSRQSVSLTVIDARMGAIAIFLGLAFRKTAMCTVPAGISLPSERRKSNCRRRKMLCDRLRKWRRSAN